MAEATMAASIYSKVLALETSDGDIKIAYASPEANVVVDGGTVYAEDAFGNTIPVESYYEDGLDATGTLVYFWDEVFWLRNSDVRCRLIGG